MSEQQPKYKSTILRIKEVREIVDSHYEMGRQDKCLRAVYRNFVKKQKGISERTFYKYLSFNVPDENKQEIDKKQLKIFE